jgi:mRNA-degrading endonuclease RelE of RelBE toxin-antitoxin system
VAVKYTVELTTTAQKVYERLFAEAQACIEAGDVSNSRVTHFNMIEEALDKIIPHDPFAPERSLSGPHSGAFRVKKGRCCRICYAGSSDQKRLVVLYISDSPRKAGDTHDPYSVFTKLVKSGKFDDVFQKLRVRRPGRKGT